MAVGIKQGRFQFQYGTSEEWERSDLILLRGEPAFEADTTKIKFGDGRSLYKDLPYVSVGNLKVTDFTEDQQKMIQGPPGPKGDPLTYDALTPDQRLELKGDRGEQGPIGPPGKDGAPGQPGKDGSDASVEAGTGLSKSGATLSVDTSYVATKADLKSYAKASDVPKLVTLTQAEYNKLAQPDADTYYFITV